MKKKAKCDLCGKQFEISWWGGLCPYCFNKKNPASLKRVIGFFSNIDKEKRKKFIIGLLVMAFIMWIWQYGDAITAWRRSIFNPFDQ